MSAALASHSETHQAAIAGAVAAELPPLIGSAATPLPQRSRERQAKMALFVAHLAEGMTHTAAAKAAGVSRSTARSFAKELRSKGLKSSTAAVREGAARSLRSKLQKSADRYAELAPLLRAHLEAGLSVARFSEQHRIGHRTVGRIAGAYDIEIPKPGPRAQPVDDTASYGGIPDNINAGSYSGVLFTRRCQCCGVIFERHGLSVVVCQPCGGAA